MKIKSLLLGSAAAMFAVSGASAADAIVAAEPEPVEYVRVCDAFGNGYFYIPGTETCLRISGYVWFQVGGDSAINQFRDVSGIRRLGRSTYEQSTRARVNIDARSDTEWGELASRIRIQSTWGTNTDGPASIDQGWIRLGGLFMGYSESYWANAYNTGASNWGSHSWGGLSYGYNQRQLIGYTYNSGTFFISGSLENDQAGFFTGAGPVFGLQAQSDDDWTPDVTGKIGGTFGGATVWLKAAYDSSVWTGVRTNGANGFETFTSAWSIGAGLAVDLGPGNFRLLGYYNDGNTSYGSNLTFQPFGIGSGSTFGWTPEWSIIASYGMDLGSNLYGSIGFQWFDDFYTPAAFIRAVDPANVGGLAGTNTGIDGWQGEISLVWTPVTNFEIRGELTYRDIGSSPFTNNVNVGDQTLGFVRFQRNF